MMRLWRIPAVAALAALLVLPLGARAHEGAPVAPEASPLREIARTTVYTFLGDRLDRRHWATVERPGAGLNTDAPELQYYTADAVTLDRGVLHLSALSIEKIDPATGISYPYESGRIESTEAFLYGRFEVRLKVPIGNGLWPAVWMRTPLSAGPIGGQIDIFDGFGSQTQGMTASVDTWANGRHVQRRCIVVENYASHTGCRRIGNPLRARVNFAKAYHTFAIDWRPDHITWFVDGRAYWTVTSGVPNVPMILVMDLAVGGAQDGPPTNFTKFAADFEIASVAISR